MNKVPNLTQRQFLRILHRKGFQWVRTSGSHRILAKGATTVSVPRSLASHGVVANLIKQTGLTSADFEPMKRKGRG